jgi:ATP-binding cassette subfamily B protein
MSFFAGLNAEKYDRQYSDRALVRRIVIYFKPHGKRLLGIGILVLVYAGFGALMPVVVSYGLNLLKAGLGIAALLIVPGILLALGVGGWFANMFRRRLTVRAISDVIMQLQSDAFRAATEHDLSFYDEFSSGRIVSRITSDTRDFGQLVTLVTDLMSQVVEAGILAIVLVGIEWHLSLYLFAMMPLILLLAFSFRRIARRVTLRGMQAMANVNAAIKETVSGIAVAKNFRQEASIYTEFDEANRQSYRVNVSRGFILSLIFPILNAITGIATAVMVYVGGLNATEGLISAGAWYLFLLSLDRFLSPMVSLSSFWTQVQSGLSASERIFALIDAEAAVKQTDARPVSDLRGQIDFEHVNFRYNDKEQVLEDFSLHVPPGETLALVGHTGAGKSSIARLIERFYEFQGGHILIDGQDIRSLDLGEYRRHLGIVTQTPFLFAGTVIDNIRYARPNAGSDEIEDLARQIGGGEWMETLPEGLLTEVGERGARLSMGQRQLVSLMRVLVQRPAIFILDEATASIDPFTEWQIQQALNLILRRSTSILIAHRLSTVKSANRIIVIEAGSIIEEGSHDRLMAAGGHYASLYNTYFRHQSLEYVEQAGEFAREKRES